MCLNPKTFVKMVNFLSLTAVLSQISWVQKPGPRPRLLLGFGFLIPQARSKPISGPAWLGPAWPGFWPQAGASTSLSTREWLTGNIERKRAIIRMCTEFLQIKKITWFFVNLHTWPSTNIICWWSHNTTPTSNARIIHMCILYYRCVIHPPCSHLTQKCMYDHSYMCFY